MHSTKKIFWAVLLTLPLLFGTSVFAQDVDDTIPEVTARVARFTFVDGDVEIRRHGNDDWEKAVVNLPIVEGDEITTNAAARFEIQFGAYAHVRVGENAYLTVTGLKDGAVALSLPEGTLSVSLTKFDVDKSYFEIDAPKTTVAVQKAGTYRIDAGKEGDTDVRVTVTNDGEARVYSETSGFTLKDDRSASIKIDGPLAGEWESEEAAVRADAFDTWTFDRDAEIAARLKDAYYDKYYDSDVYGAEDLDGYGQWVHKGSYGYVWRPNPGAIGRYTNWSPYRYGHWRWIPPFGWTWVNDEPWGWATYHHGRWFYDDGYWYWTPYAQHRTSRSWWYPALVGLSVINNNVCWYPLPYNYGYYNYNYYYGNYGGHHGGNGSGHNGGGHNGGNGGGHNGGNGGGPVPTPTPAMPTSYPQGGPSVFANNDIRKAWFATPPLLRVPPSGVVSTSIAGFGRTTLDAKPAAASVAKAVLTRKLAVNEPVRLLPTFQPLDSKVSAGTRSVKPRNMTEPLSVKTGAMIRAGNGPLDGTLRTTKILGDRQPVQIKAEPAYISNTPRTRRTGAVTRTPVEPSIRQAEPIRPEVRQVQTSRQPRNTEPVKAAPIEPRTRKSADDRPRDPVRAAPPSESTRKPRFDPPTRTEPVRSEPTRNAPTRSEPVRTAPTRSEPTRSAPTRSAPSPSKSEPVKAEPAPVRRSKNN